MELFALFAVTLVVPLKVAEAEPIQLAKHPGLKTYVDQAIAALEERFEAKCETLLGTLAEHEADNLVLRKELSEHATEQEKIKEENTLLREELREHATELAKLGVENTVLREKLTKHASALEKFEAKNELLQQRVDSLEEKVQMNSAKFNPSVQTDRINDKLETNMTEPMAYRTHHDNHDKTMQVVEDMNNSSRLKGSMRDGKPSMTKRGLDERAGVVENGVAFFATLSKLTEHLGANQDIPFDHVITNVGNAYNGNHGTFIAPTTGIYLFATTLIHPWDRANSYGHFVVSGKVVAKLRVQNYQSSQTVIVRLNQGDDVSVQNTDVDKDLNGDGYSSFTGALLFEDYSSPVVVG